MAKFKTLGQRETLLSTKLKLEGKEKGKVIRITNLINLIETI